jgi:hypothetical protein
MKWPKNNYPSSCKSPHEMGSLQNTCRRNIPHNVYTWIEKDKDLQTFIQCGYAKRLKMVRDGTYWAWESNKKTWIKINYDHWFPWIWNDSWMKCFHTLFYKQIFVWFKVFLKGPCHMWVVVLMPLKKGLVTSLCN